jgi:hypothetical protein
MVQYNLKLLSSKSDKNSKLRGGFCANVGITLIAAYEKIPNGKNENREGFDPR